MSEAVQSHVTAYLTVEGGLDAIALYERAFGAELLTHKMAADPAEVDAAMAKAAAAGCTVTTPAMDASWGMRYGRLKDPFGHAWAFGAPLPDKSEKST